ncbi:MAG: glycosyltransferase family 4 protein [bacterium]
MMKKILYVHHGAVQGGATLALLSLLEGLDRTRYEPVICCSDARAGEVSQFFAAKGYQVTTCPLKPFSHTTGGGYALRDPLSWGRLLSWLVDYRAAQVRLAAVLEQVKPDLVHFNSLVLAPYAQVAARMRISVIVHERESVLPGTFGIRTAWLRGHINRNVTAVLFICEDYARRMQVREEITHILYDGVDFTRFAPQGKLAARAALDIPSDAQVVLFSGGAMATNKGRDPFLAAMGPVLKHHKDLQVLLPSFLWPIFPRDRKQSPVRVLARIFGYYRSIEGPVEKWIKKGKLEHCLHFYPYRDDIETFIAASDVVCIPHTLPHCSLTLLQAWGMQKAVVVTRIGGLEEFAQDGDNALVVAPGDAQQLADAVSRLLSDEDLNRQIGMRGHDYALKTFALPQLAQKLNDIYNSILNKDETMESSL